MKTSTIQHPPASFTSLMRDAAPILNHCEVRHTTPVGAPVIRPDDRRCHVADVMERLVLSSIFILIGRHSIVHGLEGSGRKNWLAVPFDERIFFPPCYGSVLLRGCGA